MNPAVERRRIAVAQATDPKRKSQLGQYFTPASIAAFMASLFSPVEDRECWLLDAGAGVGSLSAAFLERWNSEELGGGVLNVHAFELDSHILPHLKKTLHEFQASNVKIAVHECDFIQAAVDAVCGSLFGGTLPRFTYAILNPPYKKIRSNSTHRLVLREAGIETVNLYTAFLALAVALSQEHGQIVAIVPRSFCNGPYYRPFREFVLGQASLQHIHLFSSRKRAFKDDGVLQENVIVKLVRGADQREVTVSVSDDDTFTGTKTGVFSFEQVVAPGDRERFIHIPTPETQKAAVLPPAARYSLEELEISVSTGPVVDFRLRDYLRGLPESDTVPLIYPGHLEHWKATWPKEGFKKPNAIQFNSVTEKWLYPTGYYCVVRRFSSKEEKRRVVASVIRPEDFPGAELLGFENHLNVYHRNKRGLEKSLAYGLAAYLNTTAVDESFRIFNGHTQVNATDLRSMKYPGVPELHALGAWAADCEPPDQAALDERLEALST